MCRIVQAKRTDRNKTHENYSIVVIVFFFHGQISRRSRYDACAVDGNRILLFFLLLLFKFPFSFTLHAKRTTSERCRRFTALGAAIATPDRRRFVPFCGFCVPIESPWPRKSAERYSRRAHGFDRSAHTPCRDTRLGPKTDSAHPGFIKLAPLVRR